MQLLSPAVDPYIPFEHRNVEHPTTVLASIFHLLKSCLGTGILAMPSAFKNAGLLVGIIGVIIAGFAITHSVHVLVKTSQNVCVLARKPSMSFSETCGAAFFFGPERLKPWGPIVEISVDYALALCYIGILCVYVVFIGASIKEVTDAYTPGRKLPIQVCCAMTLFPLILICQIRNLKFLVPFSVVANIGILIVFAITLYYIFTDLPPFSERQMVASVSKWPLFLSTVVFAMEGVGMVMPVENEMAEPERFLGLAGVLNISMLTVTIIYGFVGFFGYVKYGDEVQGSITLSLPQHEAIAQSTKLLMAFVIFLSFAIQCYVPMEIITRKLREGNTIRHENVIQIVVRTGIVCFAVSVAALFPDLELAISFVGAIFFSTFGLLIPVLIETVYLWERNLGFMMYVLWKNLIIAAIAIMALVTGSYVSLEGIIEKFYS